MHDDPDLSEEQAIKIAKTNVGYWVGIKTLIQE